MSKIRVVLLFLACSTLAGAQDSGQTRSQPKLNPRMLRIAPGILPGLLDHMEFPKYPEEALKSRTQGTVVLKIVVDESGKVILGTPVEGEPLLAAASFDGLRSFRFRPYLFNRTPIKVESEIGFRFSIKGHGENVSGSVECLYSIPFQPGFGTGIVTDKGVLVLDPRKVSGAEPQLPSDLAGRSGSVYLTITIGTDGRVQDVKVVGGDEPFIDPVVAAVKQFVYEPELVDGKPSIATTQAIYHFGPPR